jgi:hypothetical protein
MKGGYDMKNWTLFRWAAAHLKVKDGDFQKCIRNYILILLMNLSGVKPKDVDYIYIKHH